MIEVYLLLGSNQGNSAETLWAARLLIAEHCGAIGRQSLLYETEAWGIKEQNAFLNQALLVSTNLAPTELLGIIKQMEQQLGRIETTKWGPRVIDIDILFYGNKTVDLPELKIPHPYIQQRRFTLAPINEIAPDFVHPVLGKTMKELLEICEDNSKVRVKA